MSNHQNPPSHAPRLHWMTTKFASNQKPILSLAFPPKNLVMLGASVNGGKEERVQISRSIPSGAVHVGCGSSSRTESDSAAMQRRHFWPLWTTGGIFSNFGTPWCYMCTSLGSLTFLDFMNILMSGFKRVIFSFPIPNGFLTWQNYGFSIEINNLQS